MIRDQVAHIIGKEPSTPICRLKNQAVRQYIEGTVEARGLIPTIWHTHVNGRDRGEL